MTERRLFLQCTCKKEIQCLTHHKKKMHYPITRRQILDWSKLKQSTDDNFTFDENTRKFSKRVENTVGKGEIGRYEQFLLFPQCFEIACFPEASKGVIVWEWVKPPFLRVNLISTNKRICIKNSFKTYNSLPKHGKRSEKNALSAQQNLRTKNVKLQISP